MTHSFPTRRSSELVKAEDATRAIIGTIVNELSPAHARTLFVSLSDAWQNAQPRPYHQRAELMKREFGLALRRLRTTSAEERGAIRSEEHTSELQSLMRNSYAVFCLKKNKNK